MDPTVIKTPLQPKKSIIQRIKETPRKIANTLLEKIGIFHRVAFFVTKHLLPLSAETKKKWLKTILHKEIKQHIVPALLRRGKEHAIDNFTISARSAQLKELMKAVKGAQEYNPSPTDLMQLYKDVSSVHMANTIRKLAERGSNIAQTLKDIDQKR